MESSILLTGADGFTGTHFSAAAKKCGHSVHALAADLLDPTALSSELSTQHYDYVVHLAAISTVSHANELELYQVNLFGTLNLLQALAQQPSPTKVLIASSANIYGNAAESPISESAVPAPVNHYAMSKFATEIMVQQYQSKLPLIIVRPFNYTGRGQDSRFLIPKIVSHFVDKKPLLEIGNIDVKREFNDVRWVCDTYLKLLAAGGINQTYNICSGITYSITDVLRMLTALSGHQLRTQVNPAFVRESEVHCLSGSPVKLENCLGLSQHPSLEETLKWMLSAAE